MNRRTQAVGHPTWPRDSIKGPSVYDIATLLGFAVTIPSLVVFTWQSWSQHEYFLVVLLSGYLAMLAFVARRLYGPTQRAVIRPGTEFTPEPKPDLAHTWKRPADVARVLSSANNAPKRITVVAGPSGVGKTILLEQLLASVEETTETPIHVTSYEDLATDLNRWAKTRSNSKRYLVLDQFEGCLALLEKLDPSRREKLTRELSRSLSLFMDAGDHRILLGIREEWFYQLRVISDLIPPIGECIDINHPEYGNNETTDGVRTSFVNVVEDETLARKICEELAVNGRLVLGDIQIIGYIIEGEVDNDAPLEKGVELAHRGQATIDRYFDEILDSAPNRYIALKILHALSAEERFREPQLASELGNRLFDEPHLISQGLDYLVRTGLVERRSASVTIAHDILAARFRTLSGAELDPTDRDNILYHVRGVGNSSADPGRQHVEILSSARGFRWHWLVAFPLAAVMFTRLLGFGFGWRREDVFIGPSYAIRGTLIDVHYLPIFIAHAVWVLYVLNYYSRVFSRVGGPTLERFVSAVPVLAMSICVTIGALLPESWIACVGVGGVFLGMRVLALSQGRNRVARRHLIDEGLRTTISMSVVAIFGFFYLALSRTEVMTDTSLANWVGITYFGSFVLSYACIAITPKHVSREAAARKLGLVARTASGS